MEAVVRRKLCVVVTTELTLRAFLLGPLAELSKDFEITVVGNIGGEFRVPGVAIHRVAFARRPAPWQDFRTLVSLRSFLKWGGFDLVHSFTPKAGLLAMIAAKWARVRVRVHTFTGQVWVTRSGVGRWVFRSADRVLAACASHLLADSPSQRDFLISQRIVAAEKIGVLGKGTIAGVDTGRFHADPSARQRVRGALGIGERETVFLFLGRLTRDKGVMDLARAHAAGTLLFVGPDEENLAAEIRAIAPGCRILPLTEQPQELMAACDVLCLPSYREGLGAVILEAAACGVPAIASRIYGIVDAVQDGVTGLLHEPGNVEQIRAAMARVAGDRELRCAMGEAARKRAEMDFSPAAMMEEWRAFYRRILE